jgi:hypothetical protein
MKLTVLEVLAKRHSEWIKMAMSLRVSKTDADELVSGMYLKMHDYVKDVDRIMYSKTEVNTFYIYKTIQNLHRSKYHITGKKGGVSASKYVTVDFNEFICADIDRELFENENEIEYTYKENILENRISSSYEECEDVESRVSVEEYMEDEFDSMKEEIDKLTDDWYWYDKKMYKLHTEEGMSMRAIARDTNISLKSVFLTLKSCKARVKELFKSRYNELESLKIKE